MVDESDHGLSTLLHLECWSWYHSIVADESSLLARIDFILYRLDIDLVVVDVVIRPRLPLVQKIVAIE